MTDKQIDSQQDGAQERRPKWFKFQYSDAELLSQEPLTDENRCTVLLNMLRYFLDRNADLPTMEPIEALTFAQLKSHVDEAYADYETICDRNAKNRNAWKDKER